MKAAYALTSKQNYVTQYHRNRKRNLSGLFGIESLKNLYNFYVVNGSDLKYLLSFKFSQDHLKTFFSVTRSKGGFNNNPNCLHFKAAIRRILLKMK